jgi:hypothetical protein
VLEQTTNEDGETRMTTRRLLPPSNVAEQMITVNGRAYTGTPGDTFDIADFDAGPLAANGWIDCGLSGPTSARPSSTVGPNALFAGMRFIDTTINKSIVFDGLMWRDVLTGDAV